MTTSTPTTTLNERGYVSTTVPTIPGVLFSPGNGWTYLVSLSIVALSDGRPGTLDRLLYTFGLSSPTSAKITLLLDQPIDYLAFDTFEKLMGVGPLDHQRLHLFTGWKVLRHLGGLPIDPTAFGNYQTNIIQAGGHDGLVQLEHNRWERVGTWRDQLAPLAAYVNLTPSATD